MKPPPEDPIEVMDSSVCLKRKDRPDSGPSLRVRLSRSRSSEPSRKLRASASPSPSSEHRGVHRRLPAVSSDRPSRA